MQIRTLLGATATCSALAWSAMLIKNWCAYTIYSACAKVDMYLGEAQRAAIATAFNQLAFKSLLASLLLMTGILLLTTGVSDQEATESVPASSGCDLAPRPCAASVTPHH